MTVIIPTWALGFFVFLAALLLSIPVSTALAMWWIRRRIMQENERIRREIFARQMLRTDADNVPGPQPGEPYH